MQQESRPIPDPTQLTTEQLDREIHHLRDLLESRMDGRERLTDERLNAVRASIERVEQLANVERESLKTRIDSQKERLDRGDGRISGQTAVLAAMIAVATVILGLLMYLKQ